MQRCLTLASTELNKAKEKTTPAVVLPPPSVLEVNNPRLGNNPFASLGEELYFAETGLEPATFGT